MSDENILTNSENNLQIAEQKKINISIQTSTIVAKAGNDVHVTDININKVVDMIKTSLNGSKLSPTVLLSVVIYLLAKISTLKISSKDTKKKTIISALDKFVNSCDDLSIEEKLCLNALIEETVDNMIDELELMKSRCCAVL